MIKLLYCTLTMVFLMGIAHIALTPLTYTDFTLESLWFAGSGLALIILSFLIFVIIKSDRHRVFYLFGHIANISAVIFTGLILIIVFASHIFFIWSFMCTDIPSYHPTDG